MTIWATLSRSGMAATIAARSASEGTAEGCHDRAASSSGDAVMPAVTAGGAPLTPGPGPAVSPAAEPVGEARHLGDARPWLCRLAGRRAGWGGLGDAGQSVDVASASGEVGARSVDRSRPANRQPRKSRPLATPTASQSMRRCGSDRVTMLVQTRQRIGTERLKSLIYDAPPGLRAGTASAAEADVKEGFARRSPDAVRRSQEVAAGVPGAAADLPPA